MKFPQFRKLSLISLFFMLAACGDEQAVVHEETVMFDSSGSTTADSTAPGLHSDSLTAGANDWILIPGEAAGLTHINEDAAALNARLGPPDAGDAAMQKAVSVWYTNHDTSSHSVVVYSSRRPGNDERLRVLQVRVTAPRFETVRGIRVGTTEKDIRSHYKVAEVEQFRAKDGSQSKVLDSEEGIAFEIGGDGICDAIIIHAPGGERYGSYLKLRY